MTAHKPTDEQQQVIDAFRAGSTIVVEAGAGCGKSSTLNMSANAMPARRGIYVAYNKALADEAKRNFPATVQCRTAHSLAFGPVGTRYKHRLNGPRLPARQVAEILGIREPLRISEQLAPLAPQQQARIVMDAVGRFSNSADGAVDRWHFAPITGYSRPDMTELARALLSLARKAWDDLAHVEGRLKFTHDCYLKLYQLSAPTLPCDYLLLDEAQDISPVMASIFDRQTHAQRIMVGDSAQAIYGWRGAIDAMSKFRADQRLTLSQSFRFGEAVAGEANKWLSLLDARLRLRGFERVPSTLAPLADADAVLCRSNGEAVAQLMHAVAAGQRAALVGGGNDIRRLAEAARDLQNGRGTAHPELFAFSSWGEVQDYVEQDSGGSDLRVFVRLIDSHSPEAIIATVDRLVGEDRADVIVSTAHKAKGREWDRVRIAPDFREPRPNEDGEVHLDRDEAMLAYVAVTRARLVLDREGLSWVDRWARGMPAPLPAPVELPPAKVHNPAAILPDAPDELDDVERGPDGVPLSDTCLGCGEPWQECARCVLPSRWRPAAVVA